MRNGSNSNDCSGATQQTQGAQRLAALEARRARPIASRTSAEGRTNWTGPGDATTSCRPAGTNNSPPSPARWPVSPRSWAGQSRPGAGGAMQLRAEPANSEARSALARLDRAGPRQPEAVPLPVRGRPRLGSARTARTPDSPRPGRSRGPLPRSPTTPRPPGSASSSTTARPRSASLPETMSAAASACSTTTATAGSTSTVVQGGPFPAGRRAADVGRRPAVPQPGRRDVRGRHRRVGDLGDAPAATATAWPSATTTTTASPTCSSPAGGRTPSTATGATARSRT